MKATKQHAKAKAKAPAKAKTPTKAKAKRGIRLQFGVLPYRHAANGKLEVLLVTTRQSGRWIIPKGSPIKGLSPSASAAQEAFEEAGVRGSVKTRALGSFEFEKSVTETGTLVPCEVVVFPFLVARQSKSWPEQDQRICRWFDPAEAMLQVLDEGLASLIWSFHERKRKANKTTRKSGK